MSYFPKMAVSVLSVLFFLLPFIAVSSTADDEGIFTSNYDMQLLLDTNHEVVKNLELYIQAEEVKLNKLKALVKEFKNSVVSSEPPEEYISNPLNAFRLIKILTTQFKEMQDLIVNNANVEKFNENITDSKNYFKWPSEEDLNGAAVALMKLQDVYKIKTDDLSVGKLNGIEYGPVLSAHDCFEIGRQSYNNDDHYHTEVWMTKALSRYDEEDVKSVSKTDIYEYMAFSAYVQGNIKKALKYTNLLLQEDPLHERALGNKLYYENNIREAGGDIPSLDSVTKRKGDDGLQEDDSENMESSSVAEGSSDNFSRTDIEFVNYKKLCRGERIKENPQAKDYQCYMDYGSHPFLKISPVKAEQIHLNPDLIMYHEVLSDSEIETIKTIATPRFKRATVQNYKTGDLETATYRTSKTAWIKREEDVKINNIYQRVHDVTGLNMETSEELQVSNYGIGGHYDPHYDFARREEKNAFASLGTGNRIATWLFYESDVAQGGATVFTTLGLTLWPRKGSAVFWYNLYRNGEGNEDTRHAACPVLKGSKWVSNFWIHERGQEFARPCSTKYYE